MTRFLCLWFPNWPIQRLLRSRPELKARPVALVVGGGYPANGSCRVGGALVAGCSSEAAGQGVRPRMPLAEAQALARDLAIAPHDPGTDRQALEKLAEACERFSPCAALEEADEPESLLLDISNLEHLWSNEAGLAAQVQKCFTRRGYGVRMAVADTVGLAWAAAHFGEEDCKLHDHPAGGARNCKFSIADPGAPNNLQFAICNLQFAFSSLPVEALRIPPNTAALLRELGIETVGQLLSLPRESLASRFGDQLLRRIDQLTGAEPELIRPHRALAALEATYALDEPTADRAMLMHVLGQLVKRLTRQLAARDQGAVRLVCVLRSPGGRAVPMRIGLLQPTADDRQILELIDLHLETLPLAHEVDRVEIRAAIVGRLGQRQRELFAPARPSDSHQLVLLVNRLSSRLGDERVLRAQLRPSPVPERAVRYIPLTRGQEGERGRRGDGEMKRRHSSRYLPLSPSPCLPLLLHDRPYTIEVVSIAPDGPPQFVWLERRRERIVYHVGPERIETLWWRGESIRRDYYRVATESGSHLWIFRRRSDARWFLHGIFA